MIARIMYVDDEKSLLELARQMLGFLGHEVWTFTDSGEALRAFRRDPALFDLVITDQTMPGLHGLALACEMLSTRPDMPIILCTGNSGQVDERTALAAGIRKYLAKPFSLDGLAGAIREALPEGDGAEI